MSSIVPSGNDRWINTDGDLAQVLSSKIQQYKSDHPQKTEFRCVFELFQASRRGDEKDALFNKLKELSSVPQSFRSDLGDLPKHFEDKVLTYQDLNDQIQQFDRYISCLFVSPERCQSLESVG